MESLNRMAIELADEALEFAAELGVTPHELSNGATAIDFGVDADGGIEAGLLLTELQTGGLATVQSRMDTVAGTPIPHVEVTTDHPGLALLGSQKAGWEISEEGFEGLGSGPARALVAEETEFQALDYADTFDLAVLAIESDQLPTAAVTAHIADRAGVAPEAVYVPTCRTASVAGSVSGAGRAAELAVFRLFELGYDPEDILTASGSAPVPPVPGDEETAMGRVNDSVVYGGEHAGAITEPPAWERLGTTDGVRAIDADLLAAADGVYRIDDDGLTNTGLTDVRAVTGVGQPLAATADGLFRLGNGWQSIAEGAFRSVAADGHGHAHAVGDAGLLVRAADDGAWMTTTPPVETPIVDLTADRGIVAAVTDDGTLCVTAGDGWRHQRLGLPGVQGVAIGGGTDGS